MQRLLLLLTVVTGLVDAVSYLKLGHVFVANMTGNVVFVGFAIGGAPGLSISASATAIALFLVGGVAGGWIGRHLESDRMRTLATAVAIQAVAVSAAAGVAGAQDAVSEPARYVVIGLLALAMGLQNAVVRKLAVPDMTTTVLTMTLTGVAADARFAGGDGSRILVRGTAVTAMLAGAALGAVLALQVAVWTPLAAAAVLLIAVGVVAHRRPAI